MVGVSEADSQVFLSGYLLFKQCLSKGRGVNQVLWA